MAGDLELVGEMQPKPREKLHFCLRGRLFRPSLNQRVCVFQPLPGISHAFVLFSIRPLLAAVEASETATTVIHLGKNDIDRFRVLRPANEVLNAFNDVVRPLYLQIVQGKQMAANLAALRDTLLPRLISGQLRLPEAEALIA
ncbi:hypothetical protein [Chromobacterium amazonense]|uniref:hypothetical protein n=1 Tax=Chromobacterium amazonense TaxID=1382803 RepID=UPI00111460C6|nr:hypothetical protein [Chromobacterium amazonense]